MQDFTLRGLLMAFILMAASASADQDPLTAFNSTFIRYASFNPAARPDPNTLQYSVWDSLLIRIQLIFIGNPHSGAPANADPSQFRWCLP